MTKPLPKLEEKPLPKLFLRLSGRQENRREALTKIVLYICRDDEPYQHQINPYFVFLIRGLKSSLPIPEFPPSSMDPPACACCTECKSCCHVCSAVVLALEELAECESFIIVTVAVTLALSAVCIVLTIVDSSMGSGAHDKSKKTGKDLNS